MPRTDPAPPLFLRLLGGAALVRVAADGSEQVAQESSKLLALVVYLSLAPGRTASRDELTDLLWADLDPVAARHALRQHIWQLKRQVAPELVLDPEGRSRLHLRSAIESDRDAFVHASERGEYARAVALYRGDFFPGYAAAGSGEFERWADGERAQLRARFARCAEMVIRANLDRGRSRDAVELARRLRDEEPLRQHAWRVLLESLTAAKDALNAVLEAEALERLSAHEGFELEAATRSLIAAARRVGAHAGDTGAESGLRVELVGREREFSELLLAWQRARGGRLSCIHLSAPAGLGKTRLLSEFRARLGSLRVRCISVRANAATATMPYALASDLAEQLAALPGASGVSPRSAGVLVALCPSLSSAFSAQPLAVDGSELARVRMIALAELVRAVAEERPLAILVDDLHWCDAPSRTLIAGVTGRLEGVPVLLVSAGRPEAGHSPLGTCTEPLTLPALSRESTLSLVSSVAGLPDEAWTESFVLDLQRGTDGIPLQLVQSLQLALQQEILTIRDGIWHCEVPARLREFLESGGILRRRLQQLQAEEFTLLHVLAISALPLQEQSLLSASGLAQPVASAALFDLQQKGLVSRTGDTVAVAHDEFASAVLALSTPTSTAAAHRMLGVVLRDHARDEPLRMRVAASHLRQGHAGGELKELMVRYFEVARQRGDRRAPRVLAEELLGEGASGEAIRGVASAVTPGVRFGLLGKSRALVAGATIFALAGSIALTFGRFRGAPSDRAGEPRLLVAAGDSTGATHVYSVALGETITRAGVTPEPARAALVGALPPEVGDVEPSPVNDDEWAVQLAVPDSGVTDLFLVNARTGARRRLTWTRGDDANPGWSPDGRYIAFSTARFDTTGRRDIAILDTRSPAVRRFTSGPASADVPRWSPDGTRLAYRSMHHSGAEDLCVRTLDRGSTFCMGMRAPIGVAFQWESDTTLLVVHSAGPAVATRFLVSGQGIQDLADLPARAASSLVRWTTSPNGRWVLTSCRANTDPARDPCIIRTDVWEAPRPVALPALRATPGFSWRLARSPSWLYRLRVLRDTARVVAGTPWRLSMSGEDAQGGIVQPRALTFRSLDTSVATVDARGTIRGLRDGDTRVIVSAGGWRETSIPVHVSANPFATLLSESWTDPRLPGWRLFGDPRPVVDTAGTGAALFVDGDDNFVSGAYFDAPFDGTLGVAVRITLSTPASRRTWQTLTSGFELQVDREAFARWDHASAYPWSAGRLGAATCLFEYPLEDESADVLSTARVEGSATPSPRAAAPARLRSGAWYTITVQLFPDGGCGVALDGRAWMLSAPAPAPLHSAYLFFIGRSYQTRMRVGHVEVYRGIVPGIDWDGLDRQR